VDYFAARHPSCSSSARFATVADETPVSADGSKSAAETSGPATTGRRAEQRLLVSVRGCLGQAVGSEPGNTKRRRISPRHACAAGIPCRRVPATKACRNSPTPGYTRILAEAPRVELTSLPPNSCGCPAKRSRRLEACLRTCLMLHRIKPSLHLGIVATSCALVALSPLAVGEAAAGEPGGAFFEAKVRPLFEQRCLKCHGANKQQGGLRLDSKAGWATGGDSGPAVAPGKPEESLLVNAVRYADDDLQMPPSGKLSAGEIAVLEEWVARGAPDPRVASVTASVKKPWPEVYQERKQWWNLQPVRPIEPPVVSDSAWSHGSVDRFLRARMQREGIAAAEVADPRTLIRRASLVLIGLPPSAEEVSAFVEAAQRDPHGAYEALVERLLASPHFGERFCPALAGRGALHRD